MWRAITSTNTSTHTRTVESEIYAIDLWITGTRSNRRAHMRYCVSESDIASHHHSCTTRTGNATLLVTRILDDRGGRDVINCVAVENFYNGTAKSRIQIDDPKSGM
ncbi:hypothetical protein TSMEX_007776 [Taenia solium]|eukprot:TsM_000693900 transcript=TsM_000693900 gene=TsM_000693900